MKAVIQTIKALFTDSLFWLVLFTIVLVFWQKSGTLNALTTSQQVGLLKVLKALMRPLLTHLPVKAGEISTLSIIWALISL